MLCKSFYLLLFLRNREKQYPESSPNQKVVEEESKNIDPELIDLLNETTETVSLEEGEELIKDVEEENSTQYIFSVPPEGSSALCKLGDVLIVV